jgi:glycosyltransferase involved in cell wall biosynthesis
MNNEVSISIIIPVYNVEQYLTECVMSVKNQNYSNFEIILVDDGSTDNSGMMCDSFKENNVIVIHKKNGGLSDARNKGLEYATGEYIIFLDSDDYWLDMNFLRKINQEVSCNHPDIIVVGYKKIDDTGDVKFYIPTKNCDNITELVKKDAFNICAWDKVIKRKVLTENKIEFRKNVCSEDMEWCARLYIHADRCSVLSEIIYAYRQRQGSITKQVSLKHLDDMIYNYMKCLELIQKMDSEKIEDYKRYLSKNLSMIIISLSQFSHKKQKEYYEFVKNNLYVLKYNTRKREKIIYICIKIFGVSLTEQLIKIVYMHKKGSYGKIN